MDPANRRHGCPDVQPVVTLPDHERRTEVFGGGDGFGAGGCPEAALEPVPFDLLAGGAVDLDGLAGL